jgi:hypothetical protein
LRTQGPPSGGLFVAWNWERFRGRRVSHYYASNFPLQATMLQRKPLQDLVLEIIDTTSARDEARGPETNGYALRIEEALLRARRELVIPQRQNGRFQK